MGDTSPRWQPSIGAVPGPAGTTFRVWAPTTARVELDVDGPAGGRPRRLEPLSDGTFTGVFADLGPGTRYRYRLDGDGPFPDPASRCQPDGVHGPSQVVDAGAFHWTDQGWGGVALDDLVVYELHVGTFSPGGTFAGVAERLAHLAGLGVTAIELMPVAECPGARNWGYDGAALFAPARSYGTPDDLRRLVDAAHAAGLGVLLDVVYNHAGPDGAYLARYSPYYFTARHASPWGAGIDLDGEHSLAAREFFIENAMHWVHEYHMDGLRLDATHAIQDASPRHFLAELSARVRGSVSGRQVLVIAEDHRNLALQLRPEAEGGWGLDAVWADDFHHQVRRLLAGDHEGYYRDFTGTTADLAATVRQGWFFTGQFSTHLNEARGTDPSGLSASRFVVCVQNHDQIGNRAFGERLNAHVDAAAFRAASALLLTAPETPLLFMGQEWAASTPFLYFTDHEPELGRLVTEGRRREFRDFSAFADVEARSRIPDPQAAATFLDSRLVWAELDREPHASMARLYAALLALRRGEPALRTSRPDSYTAEAIDDSTIVIRRTAPFGALLLVAVRLRGGGVLDLRRHPGLTAGSAGDWTCVLTTEDLPFSRDPEPPSVDVTGGAPVIAFVRPGAVVLRTPFSRRVSAPGFSGLPVGDRVS